MAVSIKTVQLARSTVNCGCHVCAFFNSGDDEYKVMLPFIKEGFDVGDRAVYILDKNQRTERLQRLADAGIDIAEAQASGQLDVRPWQNAYLRSGRFDQYAMIDLLEKVATTATQHGRGTARLWANMEWALLDFPGVHDIVQYESRLNYVLPNYDMATVCTYDVTKFSASVVMDILRTHPQAIVGGILRENPFYVPPDEFLLELDARNVPAA
jgi:hypothetical protein